MGNTMHSGQETSTNVNLGLFHVLLALRGVGGGGKIDLSHFCKAIRELHKYLV